MTYSSEGQPQLTIFTCRKEADARCSAFDVMKDVTYTYSLNQGNRGENISVHWLVRNRHHVLPKPEQPGENVSIQWLAKN